MTLFIVRILENIFIHRVEKVQRFYCHACFIYRNNLAGKEYIPIVRHLVKCFPVLWNPSLISHFPKASVSVYVEPAVSNTHDLRFFVRAFYNFSSHLMSLKWLLDSVRLYQQEIHATYSALLFSLIRVSKNRILNEGYNL
jgi:hypothetical protein